MSAYNVDIDALFKDGGKSASNSTASGGSSKGLGGNKKLTLQLLISLVVTMVLLSIIQPKVCLECEYDSVEGKCHMKVKKSKLAVCSLLGTVGMFFVVKRFVY